jgi:hypothetical protein
MNDGNINLLHRKIKTFTGNVEGNLKRNKTACEYILALLDSEDKGTMTLRNVDNYLSMDVAQRPSRREYSAKATPLLESQISQLLNTFTFYETSPV